MAGRLEKEWERESRDAHQVEKQLAEKEFKGKKAVRVVVDGGWSKRSLGHSYNADSGKTSLLNVLLNVPTRITESCQPSNIRKTTL